MAVFKKNIMNVNIRNESYKVIIIRKNNKHTYLRVKEDLNIYITTNYFVRKKEINRIINENINNIEKMLEKQKDIKAKEKDLYYLGQAYELENKEELNDVDKWYRKQAEKVFKERLEVIYAEFEEELPFPLLRIRKMKTRWGVCNKRRKKVTLNLWLIKKDIKIIDYVIVHELCHFIYFNHSKNFWKLVEKYKTNYKELRKLLKE